ncbi:MAG: dihydrofolate reductase family protein [Coriobacteriia bacterium]
MFPRVIIYDAVSLDGRVEGFDADIGRFYELSRAFGEDAILAGADTMLAGGPEVPLDGPEIPKYAVGRKRGPLLAIVDSRGRVRFWDWLREQEFWGEPVALASVSTPATHLAHLSARRVPYLVAGTDRVDLSAALAWLAAEYGVRTVRVESGGALNSALLDAGLVSEVSLLVHPAIADGDALSFVRAPLPDGTRLEATHCEEVAGGLVWLRYRVLGPSD